MVAPRTSSCVLVAEARTRLGTSDSVQEVLRRTRALAPLAIAKRGPYLTIDLNQLAGAPVTHDTAPAHVFERGIFPS